MSKKLVIVDVDDVLIDLNESVASSIRRLGFKDYKAENILTYDLNKSVQFKDLPDELKELADNGLGCPRSLILSLYSDLSCFENAKYTEHMYKSMSRLADNFSVVLHTQSYNTDIAKFKLDFFKHNFEGLDIAYNLCIGSDKPVFENVYAVFEDSVPNLMGYSSETKKFLVDRPQNRELYNRRSISLLDNVYRVKNFNEGVRLLIEGEL